MLWIMIHKHLDCIILSEKKQQKKRPLIIETNNETESKNCYFWVG